MPLSFDEWKTNLASRWQAWRANPRSMLNKVGVNSLYLGLAGTALYPIAEAVARGDLAALGLLYTLGAGVGVNLIANSVQQWKDESDAARQLVPLAEGQPELVAALDAMLEKLEAVDQVQSGLAPADRDWFARTWQAEAAHFKSALTVGYVTNTGSGAIGIGEATVAGEGGVAVRGNVYGDIVLGAPKPVLPQGLRPAYLNWLLSLTRNVPLAGIDRKAIAEDTRSDLDLAAVYTALFTQRTESFMERDETAEICRDADGNPEPAPELRYIENAPLKQDMVASFRREAGLER